MKLNDYRISQKLTFAALAKLIGVATPKMAERYCKGTMPREAEVVRRISEITSGKVTPNDWYDLKHIPEIEAANEAA